MMPDSTALDARDAFIAGFWQGAHEFGAGGDEVTGDEVEKPVLSLGAVG